MVFQENTKFNILKDIIYIFASILLIYTAVFIFFIGLVCLGYGEVSNTSFYIGVILLLLGFISIPTMVLGLPYIYCSTRPRGISKKYLYCNIALNIFILISPFILLI